jgi:hypothetical protein
MKNRLIYPSEYFMWSTPCPQGVNSSVSVEIKKNEFEEGKINLRLLGYTAEKVLEFYIIEGTRENESKFSLKSLPSSQYEIDEGSEAIFDLQQGLLQLKLIGNNCEDMTFCKIGGENDDIQKQLDGNAHPFAIYEELVEKGVPSALALKRLYGKKYKEGFIFYLNTEEGTGLLAATEDQGAPIEWGCESLYTEIEDGNAKKAIPAREEINSGKENTEDLLSMCSSTDSAANLCRELGEDWFLPSKKELDLMYDNLHANGHGGFAKAHYWSSTGDLLLHMAWTKDFIHGYHDRGALKTNFHVRAARKF